MDRSEAEILLSKYNRGEATAQEIAILESWYLEEGFNTPLFEGALDYESKRLSILSKIQQNREPVRRSNKLWPRIAVAAAAVTLITLNIWIYTSRHPELVSGSPNYANDVKPGKNTAILTLANGKNINLSETKTGVVIGDEKLTYSDGTDLNGRHPEFISGSPHSLLTASTPRGGTYQIILPDGTHVWLNADSKISFPVQFSGGIRKILLSGEAYFEVSKDRAHPFVVQMDKQEVTVLGTHFNVNAYEDEPKITTTLLEGLVRLQSGSVSQILHPMEQAKLSRKKSPDFVITKNIDPSDPVAWKNGYFHFNEENLESIMRKISRWYNVDVTYASGTGQLNFNGIVSRFKDIKTVLEIMEATGNVHFKVIGRRVIVII